MGAIINPSREQVSVDIYSASEFANSQYDIFRSLWRDVVGELIVLPSNPCMMINGALRSYCAFVGSEDGTTSLTVRTSGGPHLTKGSLPTVWYRTTEDHILEDACLIQLSDGRVVSSTNPLPDTATAEEKNELTVAFWGGAYCVFAAWLMGWKQDVELRDRAITRQMRRSSERSGIALEKTKILNIEPWRRKFRSISSSTIDSDSKLPCFLVRGHRTTYTASSPMFGCRSCGGSGHKDGSTPHVGTFWIAPHFVGNKENGTIHHDYRVAV